MSERPGAGGAERAVAEYAASFDLDGVPEPVREKAKLALLDTVGVCLRGSGTDYVGAAVDAERALGGGSDDPRSTVLATRDRGGAALAAFANAAGGTTLELDEGNQRAGHQAIHVVPPALAVAEHVGASGRDLLGAVVAAYETSARLADVVRPLAEGIHPHGAWAPLGAAVATGSLLGFDADRFAEAARMAVNPFVASHWAACTEGATVRNFYPAVACRHGTAAALLADAGVAGVRGAAERCLLPHAAGSDVGAADLEAAYATLGDDYYLGDSYFKVHAACRYSHAPIEAAADLEADHGIAPGDVERITVRTFEAGARLDSPRPPNTLAAKFSIPYAVAARLVLGSSGIEAFEGERLSDPRILALADRIEVVRDDAFDERAERGEWGAALEATLSDGSSVESVVRDARGGGDDPFDPGEIHGKFDRLASGAGVDDPASLRDRLLKVTGFEDAGDLLAPVRSASSGEGAP